MAKEGESVNAAAVDSLFEKALTDPSAVPAVSKYIRTGKRWDCTHKELRDKLIIIHRAKEINTKFGPAMLATVDVDGVQKTALLGSSVLFDQIRELGPNLPVLAVIRKPARAYTLSDPTPEEVKAYVSKYR